MHAAIVTGVSRGLGEALVSALLERGATVVGVGRTASARHGGPRYRHVACDLAHPALAAAAVAPALRDLAAAKLTGATLVNNAAVPSPVGLVGRLDAAEIESALAINVAAPLVMADLFLRAFPDPALPRRILNISSGAARNVVPGSAVYCVSKAALEMLTRAVAADRAESTLECVTLRPGVFDTDMQRYMRSRDPAEFPSAALFRGFAEQGVLRDPADVAARVVDRLVFAPVERGRVYLHTDLEG